MKKLFILSLLGAALTASTALGATIVTYTNSAAFNASTIVGGTATVTEDFNTNDSLFTTFDIQGSANATPGFTGGARTSRVTTTYSELITLDAGNMVAFGGTWNLAPAGGLAAGLRITVNLLGGGSQLLTEILGYGSTGDGNSPFFFGFTSDVAITSVIVSQAGQAGLFTEGYSLDNVLVEQSGVVIPPVDPPSGVPEPSTFGLAGIAMVGLGLVRRFRR
jgi:hypothetical protein